MNTSELLDDHDAVGLAGLVRQGAVTPAELLEAVVTRIEERDPTLRAFVSTRFEAARAEAAAELPDGPLRGVPFAVKDLGCDVAGMVTTEGSRLFADAVAERDGVLATRYRRAGLVVVGKTNTPEFGKNASTEPLLHGPSHNPWRTTHSTGGSSGGSAAAVAGGMLPAAHANDGGGSIRIPAACCGLFGLKPSRGRVPDDHGLSALAYPLSMAHAVTRTVRDSAALLDVVAAPLPATPTPRCRNRPPARSSPRWTPRPPGCASASRRPTRTDATPTPRRYARSSAPRRCSPNSATMSRRARRSGTARRRAERSAR